jgi:carboxypeptidase PM20D1
MGARCIGLPPSRAHDEARRHARTIREIFPETVVAPGLMIDATDSRHFIGIADNIFRFSPVRATPQDLTRFHGTNERISIENYAEMIRFYRRLIRNAAGM